MTTLEVRKRADLTTVRGVCAHVGRAGFGAGFACVDLEAISRAAKSAMA